MRDCHSISVGSDIKEYRAWKEIQNVSRGAGGAAKFSSYFVQLHRKSNKNKLGQTLQHLLRLAALFQYELLESPCLFYSANFVFVIFKRDKIQETVT